MSSRTTQVPDDPRNATATPPRTWYRPAPKRASTGRLGSVLVEDGRAVGVRGRGRSGAAFTERARIVIGADGLHSTVAKAVGAPPYHEKPRLLAAYYSYFSGVPMDGRFETYVRTRRGMAGSPTNDGLTLVIAGWPYAEFDANRKDVEGNFWKTLETCPAFAERVRAGKREERFVGTAVPNYFRKPFGPGWALVGDAGYNKDFITAQGITDAFRDAEACAAAVDAALAGRKPYDAALGEYQAARDGHALPMYEFTAQLATLEPPSPELQRVLEAVHGNREAMDSFVHVNAGVDSPAEFFSEANVGRLLSQAASR